MRRPYPARGLVAVLVFSLFTLSTFASALAQSGADAPDAGASPVAAAPPATTESPPGRPPGTPGPIIELPPEPPVVTPPPPLSLVPPLSRGVDPLLNQQGSFSTDLGTGRRIPIGAYGELNLLRTNDNTQFTLRRIVLFFGHRFADWAAVYTELEVENVKEFEIEQSYLEFTPFKKARFGVRVGLMLIPLGIVNLYHEPPTYHGVDRPTVDQIILPSTWRELGMGFYGRIVDGLHFQVYAVAGSDGSQFGKLDAAGDVVGQGRVGGFGNGLSRGFSINTENIAVTGRINFNRILGLDVAAGFYYGSANSKQAGLDGLRLGVVEADARFSRWGLGLRAEYVRTFTQGAEKITAWQRGQQGLGTGAAVGAQGQGFYGEAAYNVLYPLQRTAHELWIFARYENVDPRIALPDVPNPIETRALQFFTAGLTYKPRLELAFKFDYRRTLAGDDGTGGRDRFSLGAAFMY